MSVPFRYPKTAILPGAVNYGGIAQADRALLWCYCGLQESRILLRSAHIRCWWSCRGIRSSLLDVYIQVLWAIWNRLRWSVHSVGYDLYCWVSFSRCKWESCGSVWWILSMWRLLSMHLTSARRLKLFIVLCDVIRLALHRLSRQDLVAD